MIPLLELIHFCLDDDFNTIIIREGGGKKNQLHF